LLMADQKILAISSLIIAAKYLQRKGAKQHG